MNTTTIHHPPARRATTVEILERGWHVLVEHLGVGDATRFIRSYYPGHGDSVKEIREFWGNKTVHEIAEEIREAKKRGEI